MLSTPPEKWDLRVPDDVRGRHHFRSKLWTFDELVELRRGENLGAQISLDVWRARHEACRRAIARLAEIFEEARIDVAVIIGNDQMEIFDDSLIPAFSVFCGNEIINSEYPEERLARMPPGIPVSIPGYIPPGGAVYRGASELGSCIIAHAVSEGFDVAAMQSMPKAETPHAFGFVYRQIMADNPPPSVPIVLNTFYPPNQPTIRRCYAFGKVIADAIAAWENSARVALIASGGLSHFVIDEAVDATFLDTLREGRIARVAELGEAIFQAGTSEIKNWIPVAGAMAQLGFEPAVIDYVPCYRTEAGTGNAMGFVCWRPK
jgi:3-O-methylgallate 3,4-dioxygenase